MSIARASQPPRPFRTTPTLFPARTPGYKNTFLPGDLVYLNHGEAQGVKIGDEFEVVRPIHDMVPFKWFKWQEQLSKAMGTMYEDVGCCAWCMCSRKRRPRN